MKAYIFILALAVLSACGKKNDAHLFQHEAVTLAKYYDNKLDVLEGRVQAIFQKGTKIPGNLPGIEEIGRRLQEARDTIIRLRGIVTPPAPDQKSAVETQAEAAARENRILDLQKLVHDTEVQLDRGITVINANLDTVEAWIAQYESRTLAMATPSREEEPGAPEEQSTPATGQPPAATEPADGSMQPKAPARAPAKARRAAQPKEPAPAAPAQP
jgi:hypothetical protein